MVTRKPGRMAGKTKTRRLAHILSDLRSYAQHHSSGDGRFTYNDRNPPYNYGYGYAFGDGDEHNGDGDGGGESYG